MYMVLWFFSNSNNILISHQRHIPHFLRPVYAPFGESGFSKEVEVLVLIWEQLTAFDQSFRHAEIDLLVRPFALAKKGSILVLLGDRAT